MLGEAARQPLGHVGNEATSKGKINTTEAELDNEHFQDVVLWDGDGPDMEAEGGK